MVEVDVIYPEVRFYPSPGHYKGTARTPAWERPAFREALAVCRRRKAQLIIDHPSEVASTAQELSEVRDAAARAGVEIIFDAETVGGRVRDFVDAPEIRRILAAMEGVAKIEIAPSTVAPEHLGWDLHCLVTGYDDAGQCHARVFLKQSPLIDDLAHELVHIQMESEGYPMFAGGEEAFDWTNTLLDIEVDRRVSAAGLHPELSTDSHMRARLRKGTPLRLKQPLLLSEYVMRSMLRTADMDLRARYLATIRQREPVIGKLGNRIVAICRNGAALRTAGDAVAAFEEVRSVLLAAGTRNLTVSVPKIAGPARR